VLCAGDCGCLSAAGALSGPAYLLELVRVSVVVSLLLLIVGHSFPIAARSVRSACAATAIPSGPLLYPLLRPADDQVWLKTQEPLVSGFRQLDKELGYLSITLFCRADASIR